jgi:hypothetical protein
LDMDFPSSSSFFWTTNEPSCRTVSTGSENMNELELD